MKIKRRIIKEVLNHIEDAHNIIDERLRQDAWEKSWKELDALDQVLNSIYNALSTKEARHGKCGHAGSVQETGREKHSLST